MDEPTYRRTVAKLEAIAAIIATLDLDGVIEETKRAPWLYSRDLAAAAIALQQEVRREEHRAGRDIPAFGSEFSILTAASAALRLHQLCDADLQALLDRAKQGQEEPA